MIEIFEYLIKVMLLCTYLHYYNLWSSTTCIDQENYTFSSNPLNSEIIKEVCGLKWLNKKRKRFYILLTHFDSLFQLTKIWPIDEQEVLKGFFQCLDWHTVFILQTIENINYCLRRLLSKGFLVYFHSTTCFHDSSNWLYICS